MSAAHFSYELSLAVSIPGGGRKKRRFVVTRGQVRAPEGEGAAFGRAAIATALEHAAGEARKVAEAR